MKLPKLKLLTAIFGQEIISTSKLDPTTNEITIFGLGSTRVGAYNIYELMHLCKEWAEGEGYSIMSRGKSLNQRTRKARALIVIEEEYKNCTFRLNVMNFEDYEHEADTEPEAVFRACEFLMEYEENEDTEISVG